MQRLFIIIYLLFFTVVVNASTVDSTYVVSKAIAIDNIPDINGDGELTVDDITCLSHYILNHETEGIDVNVADINNDGNVDIVDMSLLIAEVKDASKYVGHEYVDLGLSVLWATCNVGATTNSDHGLYYAWGETAGYTSDTSDGRSFEWTNYSLCGGSSSKMTKYCINSSNGVVDSLTTLELSDDAASVNWGGAWRMPTFTELKELRSNCYWKWTTDYNGSEVAGFIIYKVKSDSDKGKFDYNGSSVVVAGSYSTDDTHIFLPVTGYRSRSSLSVANSYGCYWSSTLSSGSSYNAYNLYFCSYTMYWVGSFRSDGRCIRPVINK